MAEFKEADIIYDWNRFVRTQPPKHKFTLDDETLRDGLQSPSITDPPLEAKLKLVHLMESLGIGSADIGLPGAGPHVVSAVTEIAREIVEWITKG